jgi:hypothetical protein
VVGGGAELGDRDRLALRHECTHAVGEPVGDLDRPVGIHGHDVEACPVDALEMLYGGVGDLAAETLADERRGLGQELVDAGVLGRAVARGEVPPEALHPRVATVAVVLLRNEYITRGTPTVPDGVLAGIVDEV